MSNDNLYYNKPQLLSAIVNANEEYHVLGRGTGKSSGILAHKSIHNINKMPRSCGFNVAETFAQILTRTLPSLVAGWQKLGYYRDVHYIIGKRPSLKWQKIWNWKEPYEPPVGYDRFISFNTGAGIHLISQDVKGGSLGLNTDWGFGDEAKNLKKEQFDEETAPTMRSNKEKFGHLAEHQSLCFTTSMPTKADGKWILKMQEHMDDDLVKLIVNGYFALQELLKLENPSQHYLRQIVALQNELNLLRKKCVFYQEASSFENIAVLGIDYIRKMKRTLPKFIFETEILNLRQDVVEGSFYPSFDIDKHTVRPMYNNSYLESLGYELSNLNDIDCRQDAELHPAYPLRGSIDWGGYLNFMSIAQWTDKYRFIKELYVEHPQNIKHLAIRFAKYYKHHKTKVLELLYDHTGNTIKEQTSLTNADFFIKELLIADKNWIVKKLTKGRALYHDEKFKMIYKALLGDNKEFPQAEIVEEKCKYLIISIQNAPLKEGNLGVEKDKSSEKKRDTIPALEATHASDTFDIHIGDVYNKLLDRNNYYIGL